MPRRNDSRALFSSKSDHWETPQALYNSLHAELRFDFDPCPLRATQDGLSLSWKGKRAFVNPPYSNIGPWVEKSREADVAAVLVPARTGSRWWHEQVLPHPFEIRFLRGRLKFGGLKVNAPFDSVVLVWRNPCSV